MKLFIATPCYGGMVTANYMLSLIQLNNALRKEKIPFTIVTLGNESLITRARNLLAAEFLDDADASHLLFIDADISFGPEVVFRLLGHGGQVVAAVCPKKTINWQSLFRHAPSCKSAEDLRAVATEYVINVQGEGERFNHETLDGRIQGGFVRVTYAGTGFMLIERAALTAIRERYPENRFFKDSHRPQLPGGAPECCGFFETLIHPVTHRYLSEDYAFCYRWRSCGGDIWLDVQCVLGHEGPFLFEGNPARLAEMLAPSRPEK